MGPGGNPRRDGRASSDDAPEPSLCVGGRLVGVGVLVAPPAHVVDYGRPDFAFTHSSPYYVQRVNAIVMNTKILIINGPNLNRLGERDPKFYGSRTMEDCLAELRAIYKNIQIDYFQSNCEGAIIDRIQRADIEENVDGNHLGIVINAGAYTHTSLAIADAIGDCRLRCVEIHLSNIAAREPIRRTSLISPVCCGSIAGFGIDSYRLGVEALVGIKH